MNLESIKRSAPRNNGVGLNLMEPKNDRVFVLDIFFATGSDSNLDLKVLNQPINQLGCPMINLKN